MQVSYPGQQVMAVPGGPQVIYVTQGPPPMVNDWKAPFGCTCCAWEMAGERRYGGLLLVAASRVSVPPYSRPADTCFCTLCAASDVADHLMPGSWGNYCCMLYLMGCIPYAGSCVQGCHMLSTRQQLSYRYGIRPDGVDCCAMTFCSPCYIGQEVRGGVRHYQLHSFILTRSPASA